MRPDSEQLLGWTHAVFPSLGTGVRVSRDAFHEVVIGDSRAARVLIGADQATRAARECAILAQLPQRLGPVELPRLLSSATSRHDRVGYLTSRIPGNEQAPEQDHSFRHWPRDRHWNRPGIQKVSA